MHATLVAARTLSPSVRELTLDPGVRIDFAPGQWVNVFSPFIDGDERVKRAYSLADAARDDGRLVLAVTRVPGGRVSGWLCDLPVGTMLEVSAPQGIFVLEPVVRPVVFVATGSGVAPFRAMIRHLAAAPPAHPVVLLHGVRTAADALYGDELHALASKHPWLAHHVTLSRGDDAWGGLRGHVQAHVADLVRPLGSDVDAYVCGLSKMVGEVRTLLREGLAVPRKQVHVERYD